MIFRVLVMLCWMLAAADDVLASQALHSYAIVQDDGSLLIERKRVHLYGVYLPDTDQRCRTNISPIRCGSQAALALEFRIQGFVHCYPQTRNPDGSLNAICYVDRTTFDEGEDLAAYLLKRGLAVARPYAPFEYQVLERIARHQQRGVWGFPVDSVTVPGADRPKGKRERAPRE